MTFFGITGITTPGRFNNPNTVIGDIVGRVLVFAVLAAGLYFLVRALTTGYTVLTSGGDPAKLQTATRQLTNAIIGLVIVISIFFIGQIIETILGINIL